MNKALKALIFKSIWKRKGGEQIFAILNDHEEPEKCHLLNVTIANSQGTCEVNPDTIYAMHETDMFIGFMHTHPFGSSTQPSALDISMHTGWANSLGMVIECLIFNGSHTSVSHFIPNSQRDEYNMHIDYHAVIPSQSMYHFKLARFCNLFLK